MWNDAGRYAARARCAAAVVLATTLTLMVAGAAEARNDSANQTAAAPVNAPVAAPPLDPSLRGPPLDPAWPKHVYVITDSVMLGAKPTFIRSLPDWQVTYAGRPALMIRKALPEVRQQSSLGPVAVVALGYNSLWEKDRKNFKRWSDLFDTTVEEMLATLKERGARKIVWVMLRELTPDILSGSRASAMQYQKYAWYFPYANERLRAIKARHPEMALADWATAAHQTGLTYDAIHLNTRGAQLMTEVVKVAMGLDAPQPRAASTIVASAPEPRPALQPVPSVEPQAPITIRETRIRSSAPVIPRREQAPIAARETPRRAPEAGGPPWQTIIARAAAPRVESVAPPGEDASIGPQENPPARALAYAGPLPERPSISAPETHDTLLSPSSAPPTRATSARGNWVIQIGAFPAEEQAKGRLSEAQNLGKALLANASSFTERVMKGQQELYRARFAGFDRNAAEAACSYFKRNDIDCISVMAGR
jgi:hypothetical protein